MQIKIDAFTLEAASKAKGLVLRNMLENNVENADSITVDFNHIIRFASPFFNNSFAALALKYGVEKIRKIQLINISPIGQNTYETSMQNAEMLLESPEFADEVDKIIQETPKETGNENGE